PARSRGVQVVQRAPTPCRNSVAVSPDGAGRRSTSILPTRAPTRSATRSNAAGSVEMSYGAYGSDAEGTADLVAERPQCTEERRQNAQESQPSAADGVVRHIREVRALGQ